MFGFGREHVSPNRSLPDILLSKAKNNEKQVSGMETQTLDTSKETIERLFNEQMMFLTREANRKLRSFERQFTLGAA